VQWIGQWICGAALAMTACEAGVAAECEQGSDCPSGACTANGRCVDESSSAAMGSDDSSDESSGTSSVSGGSSTSTTTTTSSTTDATTGTDTGPTTDGSGDTGMMGQCNFDGVITRDEVPFEVGAAANFVIAKGVEVDTAGTVQPGGERAWDYSGTFAGDMTQMLGLMPLEGNWFADDFPDATYVASIPGVDDLWGVYSVTESALLLVGVVSPEDGNFRTLVEHDPPVTVLSFPLEVEASWTTDASVSGLFNGIISNYSETYDTQVDARGQLSTPFGDLPVLRVRIELTRQVGLQTTTVRSFLFVTECFGSVASIVAQDNEPSIEFTNAKEIRRLGT
jgi:hypothetical protein